MKLRAELIRQLEKDLEQCQNEPMARCHHMNEAIKFNPFIVGGE